MILEVAANHLLQRTRPSAAGVHGKVGAVGLLTNRVRAAFTRYSIGEIRTCMSGVIVTM